MGVFLFLRFRGDTLVPPPDEEEREDVPMETSIEPMDDEDSGPPVIEMSLLEEELIDDLEIETVDTVVVGYADDAGGDLEEEAAVEVSIMGMEDDLIEEEGTIDEGDDPFDEGLIPEV